MSFIGAMLNPSKGADFNAVGPQNSDIVSGKDVRQFQGQTQTGLDQQKALYEQLGAQGGLKNQSDVFAQQQALAQQLQQQAAGGGPNPALAQLQAATGQNTANQAALMAGQRGVGQNAGLIARQAAQQGAANQQNMNGQAATLQAQQQLAAQQALAQQQASLQNVAGQQVSNQMNQGNAYTQNALGATTGFLNAATGLQSNANNANASIAGGNQKAQAGLLSGALGGIGSAFGLAHGGEVPGYAIGGDVTGGAGGSALASFLNSQTGSIQDFGDASPMKMGGNKSPAAAKAMIAGGPMDNMGMAASAPMMVASRGGHVPGKAATSGDSSKNDTVPTMLSPGEIVIPRSIVNGPNASAKAAKFVNAILAKNGRAK